MISEYLGPTSEWIDGTFPALARKKDDHGDQGNDPLAIAVAKIRSYGLRI